MNMSRLASMHTSICGSTTMGTEISTLCTAWEAMVTLTSDEANAVEYVYNQGGQGKEPDQSWVPRDIDPNHPNLRLQPGSNQVYPTFVLEVGYMHESYPELLRDARGKHFSPLTSVQLYMGIKIHRATRRYQVVVLDRVNTLFETNGLLSVDTPALLTFTLPKRLMFFGTPAHLIPPTLTVDLVVPLDLIRQFIANYLWYFL